MDRDAWRSVIRDGGLVLGLVVLGQVAMQGMGRLAPGAVRYPGAWAPTSSPDTGAYLVAAADLPSFEAHHVTKLAYIALLRIDQALSLQGWGVVVIQFLALVVAGTVLLRYLRLRWSRRVGLFGVAALVLNPNITQWTKVLLTESIFMALLVIIVVLLADERRRSILVGSSLAVLAVLVRPNGIGALLGVSAVVASRLPRARLVAFLAASGAIAAVVVATPAFQSPGGSENTLAARTYEGLVIWAEPHDVRIAMPTPSDPDDLTNRAVIRYARDHPRAVAELGIRRVVAELTQVRPHYPAAVNSIIAIQMIVFFSLAGIGLIKARRDPITPGVLAVSVGLLLVIAGTWAIAEGRFGWAMFATWSPWVAVGAETVWSRAERSLRRNPASDGVGLP